MRPTPGRTPAADWSSPLTWPDPTAWLAHHGVPQPLALVAVMVAVPVVTRVFGWTVATVRPARVTLDPPYGASLPCRHQLWQETSPQPRWSGARPGSLLLDHGWVEWRPETNGGGWRVPVSAVTVIDVHGAWWVSGPSVDVEVEGYGTRRLVVHDDQRVNGRMATVNRFREAPPARALARTLLDLGAACRCPRVARWRIRWARTGGGRP